MSKNPLKLYFSQIVLFVLLILAAFLRFPLIFRQNFYSDEGLYAWCAKRIFLHPGLIFSPEISSWQPPLFPLSLSLFHYVLPAELACRFAGFLFFIWGILEIYRFGKRVKSDFVGLFAAVALLSNLFYWRLSLSILADIPFMILLIILARKLLELKGDSYREDIIAGLWATAIGWLKWSGVIVLPIVFLYYMLGLSGGVLKQRIKKFFIFLGVALTAPAAFFINNFIHIGSILPAVPGGNVSFKESLEFYLTTSIGFLSIPDLRWLLLIGVIALWWERRSVKVVLLSFLSVFFLGIVAIATTLDGRYVLFILPVLIILAGLGAEKIISWVNNKKIFGISGDYRMAVIIILFLFGQYMGLCHSVFFKQRNKSFLGYEEAGTIIKSLYSPGTAVLAGSERQIRYYTDINYKEYGGDLLPLRHSREELEEFIRTANSDVIVVVDRWEQLQPRWLFEPDSDAFWAENGFTKVGLVKKELYANGRLTSLPCVIILKKDMIPSRNLLE